MSFLKNLGAILTAGTKISATVAQTIPLPGTAKTADALMQIAGVVGTVESIANSTGMKGPQKLIVALPLVQQVLQNLDIVKQQGIAKMDLFRAAVEKITSGVVDLLNSLNPPKSEDQ